MLLKSFILALFLISAQASITDYISKSDHPRFFTVLTKTLANHTNGDLIAPYYGARGLSVLGEPFVEVLKLKTCTHIQQKFKADAKPEVIFHVLSTWSILICHEALGTSPDLYSKENLQVLKSTLSSEASTVTDIRYALESLIFIKETIDNPTKVAQLIQAQLKSDDSLQNIGQGLHAASLLGSAGQFINQYIEDVIVQADEVDGKLLQWEGGLTITGLLLTGLLRLPQTTALSQVQADKFANYLLTRKTVQSPKGVIALIDSALALSKSSVSPACITYLKSSQVTTEKPDLQVHISDILGKPYKPSLTSVVAQSATRVADDVVVLSKQPLTPTADSTQFILSLKLDPGQYRVSITAGSHSAALNVHVLGPVTLKYLEVGLDDSDGTAAPRLTKLQYPAKLDTTLQADSSHHLIVKFSLSRSVHQAFIRLSSGKNEIVFVAEQDNSKVYKVDVNLATELKYSAVFDLELILGDSIMSNPLRWAFGKVDAKLTGVSSEPKKARVQRVLQPEIKHMFRQAEPRPPKLTSTLFTALVVAPFVMLVGLWIKIGVNFNNMSIKGLLFHVGLISIFGLFILFWLQLNMFTTCFWLSILGTFTAIVGNWFLRDLASNKKKV